MSYVYCTSSSTNITFGKVYCPNNTETGILSLVIFFFVLFSRSLFSKLFCLFLFKLAFSFEIIIHIFW